MSNEELLYRWIDIETRANAEKKALFDEVLATRIYPDGAKVQRVRLNEDGSVFDDITATIVGANVWMYSSAPGGQPVPTVQYWTRVESPADYHSHQKCSRYGLPMDVAEDFWQGDERWSLIG
jgi:hypothetical protein